MKALECDEKDKYLFRQVCFHDSHETELSNRIGAAWAAFSKHNGELTDRRYRLKDRLRLFSATVTACVFYGCECWVLRKDQQKRLRAAQRKMLRMVLHAKRRRTAGNTGDDNVEPWAEFLQRSAKWVEQKLQDTGQQEWLDIWRQRQKKWDQKLAARKQRWSAVATLWNPLLHSSSRRGRAKARPVKRWKEQLEEKPWWSM